MTRLAHIFLFLLAPFALLANDIQFTASAPRVVEVGEQFEIVYTISAQPNGFRPPEFKGLSLLAGPSTSSSTSVQYINGKVTQKSTISYTYYFVANTPGTFTFEPAKATVDGKNVLSNSLSIEVVNKSQTNRQQNQPQRQQGGGTQQAEETRENIDDAANEDFFVRVLTDRTSVYQGEHIVVTYKLYTRLNLSALEKVDYPSLAGFYRQDIETPQIQLERENVNGQIYNTGILQKMVLFPQKSGTITIEPFSLQVVAQIPVRGRGRSVFDDFFGPQVREVRRTASSKPVKIEVKPLPANAPASFKGATGSFNFKVTTDKNKVKTNDAINIKISITGNGNLKMIEPFDLKFPGDFETYDPKVTLNANATAGGVNGSKTFEYLIIPRHSGTFNIGPVEFTYFDVKSKQYKTLSSGEIIIEVEKGENEGSTVVVSGVSKEEIKFIGRDIQFIKLQVPTFSQKGQYLFGSKKFYLAYLLSLLLFIVFVVVWRNKIKENANIVKVRNKRAGKVAQKRLKDAHIFMKENKHEGFYEYILKAMWGYMADKLNIPVSDLSREKIAELASSRNIDSNAMQLFLNIVDTCEFARYAPTDSASQMDDIYKQAINVISKIEQTIK